MKTIEELYKEVESNEELKKIHHIIQRRPN